jgi:hypothetical protein
MNSSWGTLSVIGVDWICIYADHKSEFLQKDIMLAIQQVAALPILSFYHHDSACWRGDGVTIAIEFCLNQGLLERVNFCSTQSVLKFAG